MNPDNPGSNNSSDQLHHHNITPVQPQQPGAHSDNNGLTPSQPAQPGQPNGESQSEGLIKTTVGRDSQPGLKQDNAQNQQQARLPQTGNDRGAAALAGAGLLSTLGAMLLGKKRKRD